MRHGASELLNTSAANGAAHVANGTGDYVYLTGAKPAIEDTFTGNITSQKEWDEVFDLMEWLSGQMGARGRISDNLQENDTIPSGYTYFGQFITHDITFNAARLPGRGKDIGGIENLNSFCLDLDNIYRGGPEKSPWLYASEGKFPSDVFRPRLRLGATRNGQVDGGKVRLEDFPRVCTNHISNNLVDARGYRDIDKQGCQYESLIGDLRNEDNLILSQMTVLFYKLHNKIVDALELAKVVGSGDELFDIARKITLKIYHSIILNDYLIRILSEDVYRHYARLTSIDDFKFASKFLKNGNRGQMPVEFTMAAMRVGHAMVRQKYQFSEGKSGNKRPSIEKLMQFNSFEVRKPGLVPITDDWIINWQFFFQKLMPNGELSPVQEFDASRKIRAAIAPSLLENRRFPSDDGAGFAPQRGGLMFRDLVRGLCGELSTGQKLAQEFDHVDRLHKEVLAAFLHDNFLNDIRDDELDQAKARIAKLSKKTPLFFYILCEAEIDNGGKHLGSLGSSVLAEVIFALLIKSEIKPDTLIDTAILKIFGKGKLPHNMPALVQFITEPQN